MFHESGCYGEVELGVLPGEIQSRLESLSGEWLEYDPSWSAMSSPRPIALCPP